MTSVKDELSKPLDHLKVDNIELVLAEECAKYYHDPYGFVLWAFDWGVGVLEGQDGPDEWQKELLLETGRQCKLNNFTGVAPVKPQRHAVASGHGIGKSALTAWLGLWVMSTRPHSKGVWTANTGDQLRTKTWSELSKWQRLCITGHWFELNSGKGSLSMVHKAYPETWRIDAQTCREENSEAFAGLHAAQSTPWYLFDEASAVPDKIWEVALGGLTDGEPMWFVFGNPTRNSGAFRNCFRRRDIWNCMQVDSRTAKMTNKEYFQSLVDEYGEDSDIVKVRVRGEFPSSDDDQMISEDLVEESMARALPYEPRQPLICGIDCAAGGSDRTVIAFRKGLDARSEPWYVIPGEKCDDFHWLAGKISEILERHQPAIVTLDATGCGIGLYGPLKEMGWRVMPIKFNQRAHNESDFSDIVAEMGWKVRQWLQDGGCLKSKDNKLAAELKEELINRNSLIHRGKFKLESKVDVKKRIGKSPDISDALYLTFAVSNNVLQFDRDESALGERGSNNQVRNRIYNPIGGNE